IEALDEEQTRREADRVELGLQLLSLRRLDTELGRDDHALLTQQLRQHRAQRAAVHLAVDLLLEAARARRERAAAADPERASDRADARAARALLLPRLLARAAHIGAILLRFRARAPGREIRRYDLVHERFVERDAERRVRELERAALT